MALAITSAGNSRSSVFASHFRENAARALLLPRRRPGKRTPLWAQRLRAQQLMGVALRFPAFPITLETYREVLRDVWTTVHPKETLVAAEDQGILPPLAVDRLHRRVTDDTTVLHLFTAKPRAVT